MLEGLNGVVAFTSNGEILSNFTPNGEILALSRLTVIFLPLRLTEILTINYRCLTL